MDTASRRTFKRGMGAFGCVFGLIFAGIPSLMMVGIVSSGGGDALPVAAFLSIFIIVGTCIALGRGVITVDKTTNELSWGWGLVVPFFKKRAPLESVSHVAITREIRRSKNSTYTVYPVRLIGDDDLKVSLGEPRNFPASRKQAEDIAKFVERDIHDHTATPTKVRPWHALDESLREQALRTGEAREIPDEPSGTRVVTQIVGSQVELTLPPDGFGPQLIGSVIGGVVLAVGTVIALTALLAALSSSSSPAPAFLVPALQAMRLIGPIVGVGVIATGVRQCFSPARVIVSPDALRIEQPAVFGHRPTTVSAADLEELEVSQGQLRAISDDKVLAFGRGLTGPESDYVRGVILGIAG